MCNLSQRLQAHGTDQGREYLLVAALDDGCLQIAWRQSEPLARALSLPKSQKQESLIVSSLRDDSFYIAKTHVFQMLSLYVVT